MLLAQTSFFRYYNGHYGITGVIPCPGEQFVVSRKYVKHFAIKTKPLTDILKGKPPTFFWAAAQQEAFDFIREKLLSGIHLAAPDFDLLFHLATDASEDGKGAELYQLPSVPIEKQYPYSVKEHAIENHAVIFFVSK
jgi:hypothetical protein